METAARFDAGAVARHITQWLHDYARGAGMHGFVVGISGGVDSAVTSRLCADTGLPVTLVEMPIHSHRAQVERGQEHIRNLCARHPLVSHVAVDLTGVYDQLVKALPEEEDGSGGLALANSRARLRMTTLYALAARRRALVAGTGNKIEDFGVGFYTKSGDGGVDLSPIADLVKTEVFALGHHLGLPDAILSAPPTDGLWGDDRTDEQQLGASYPELEWAMSHSADLATGSASVALSPREQEVLDIYQRLHRANRHKMDPIPVCVIPDDIRWGGRHAPPTRTA